MEHKELDTVVLRDSIPEHHLEAGDIGAVVTIHPNNSIEVEFVAASGMTRALLTLKPDQIRPIDPDDVLSVRKQSAA
jgi:hypothetical protein